MEGKPDAWVQPAGQLQQCHQPGLCPRAGGAGHLPFRMQAFPHPKAVMQLPCLGSDHKACSVDPSVPRGLGGLVLALCLHAIPHALQVRPPPALGVWGRQPIHTPRAIPW